MPFKMGELIDNDFDRNLDLEQLELELEQLELLINCSNFSDQSNYINIDCWEEMYITYYMIENYTSTSLFNNYLPTNWQFNHLPIPNIIKLSDDHGDYIEQHYIYNLIGNVNNISDIYSKVHRYYMCLIKNYYKQLIQIYDNNYDIGYICDVCYKYFNISKSICAIVLLVVKNSPCISNYIYIVSEIIDIDLHNIFNTSDLKDCLSYLTKNELRTAVYLIYFLNKAGGYINEQLTYKWQCKQDMFNFFTDQWISLILANIVNKNKI